MVKLNFLADGSEFLRTFNGDFEFRLLVFLHLKVAAGFRFADRGGDVVTAQRRLVAQINLDR